MRAAPLLILVVLLPCLLPLAAAEPPTSGPDGTSCEVISVDLTSPQGSVVDPDGCYRALIRRIIGW